MTSENNQQPARILDMMAPELSSNWKKLQAKLQAEASLTGTSKRKVESNDRQAKRRRIDSTKSKTPDRRPIALAKHTKRMTYEQEETRSGAQSHQDGANTSAALALWALDNDISAKDLSEAYGNTINGSPGMNVVKDDINGGLQPGVEIGKYIALDCEMVGVGGNEDRSVLARVSIVNFHGQQVYDSFVRPKEFVTDWRTHVSGVAPRHMATARSLEAVQATVEGILRDRVLVGHAIKNDLEAMMLVHPKRDIRDTQRYPGYRKYGSRPRLQVLAKEVLGLDIQGGSHSSIEDARATMLLFRKEKDGFEREHAKAWPVKPANGTKTSKKKKKGKH